MELTGELLILYIILWSLFYGFLSHYIARRSVTEWINRFDGEKNPEGAGVLLHLLKPVLDEIFNDNEQLLKDFKTSFFTSIGPQVREAKKIVNRLNPAGAALEELTKDNPLLSLIMSHVKLPNISLPSDNSGDKAKDITVSSDNNSDFGL